jgi:preprotein translocase subunit SecF
MLDLVGKRWWFLIFSIALIIPGLIFIIIGGLKPSIDFTGGSSWELYFSGNPPASRDIEQTMVDADNTFIQELSRKPNPNNQERDLLTLRANQRFTASASPSEGGLILVRTGLIGDATGEKTFIDNALTQKFGAAYQANRSSVTSNSPTVAGEVTWRSIMAVGAASIGILLYLWWAFRKVRNPIRYGACAIFSMLHDVLVVVGIFAILGFFLNVEIDALFVTALLTVIGFSVHDTIVVFDRLRENQIRYPGEPFDVMVNHSLVQTVSRSIVTSLTVIFTLLALYLFGGTSIRSFVLALLIGMISGTYSSIFNASMLLVVWETGEIGRFFGIKPKNKGGSGKPKVEEGKPVSKVTV